MNEAVRFLDSPPIKALFHAIDGGLGHLARGISIALELVNQSPRPVLPLFLVESDTRLLDCYGLNWMRLSDRDQQLRKGWAFDVPTLRTLDITSLAAIVAKWEPQLLVHDTHLWEPLVRCGNAHDCLQVAVVRPGGERGLFLGSASYDLLEEMHLIIVPSSDDFLRRASIPDHFRARCKAVGTIHRTAPPWIEHYQAPPGDISVLLTCAGGGLQSAQQFLDEAIDVMSELLDSYSIGLSIVPGPHYRGSIQCPRGFHVNILPFVCDLASLAARHSVVIAMGGYNTSAELASVPTPLIVRPQQVPSDIQHTRARELSERDAHVHIAVSRKALSDQCSRLFASLTKSNDRPQTKSRQRAATPGAAFSAQLVLGMLNASQA